VVNGTGKAAGGSSKEPDPQIAARTFNLQMIQVKDLRAFHRFLRLCAGRTGQVLNLSDLGRDADISHTTTKH
jgi:hypothetical protein